MMGTRVGSGFQFSGLRSGKGSQHTRNHSLPSMIAQGEAILAGRRDVIVGKLRYRRGAQSMAQPTAQTPIKAYWQPGCTSCLRMKEFLTKHGVPFVSVNVLEDK